MNSIYFDRLIQNAEINFEKDVIHYIQNGGKGTSEPYGDTWKHPVMKSKDKMFHISRVAWFVLHPEEIKEIEIDNEVTCDGRGILPKAIIVDGWHRILAAKILGMPKVKVVYYGRMDVLNYLQGKRKTEPTRLV